MLMRDAICRYECEVLPRKAEGTRKTSLHHFVFWKRELGDLELSEVTRDHILRSRDKLLSEPTLHGKKRTPQTVNRFFASGSHLFTTAATEWGVDVPNPFSRIKRFRESDGRTRYLSQEEIPKLLRACKLSRNRELLNITLVALYTGLRKNEILSLQWNQIDLDAGCLRLSPGQQKNRKHGAVPLIEPALKVLRSIPKRGLRVFESNDIRGAWQSALKAARIDDMVFHDLRHSCGSFLAMSGASDRVIGQVLRHSSPEMVWRYTHLRLSDSARALDKAYAQFLAPAIAQQG